MEKLSEIHNYGAGEQTNGWTDRWMGEWMDLWMDGWMHNLTYTAKF